jgi:hypothetical protein
VVFWSVEPAVKDEKGRKEGTVDVPACSDVEGGGGSVGVVVVGAAVGDGAAEVGSAGVSIPQQNLSDERWIGHVKQMERRAVVCEGQSRLA